MVWHDPSLEQLIELALVEDAVSADVTTLSCIGARAQARARVVAKEPLVVFGLAVFARVLERVDDSLVVEPAVLDGARVARGDVVVRAEGSARSLLVAERTALNFLQRLSGIATLTRAMVGALPEGSATALVDTRKTTPGWRALEKAAVRAGGAKNHRMSLADGVMIKDNHIAAAGGITRAVDDVRRRAHHLLKIEVETSSLDEVKEALAAGADVLLLDNMSDELMRAAVELVREHERASGRRVVTEASGNMTEERLASAAATGVDLISVGALTHSARAVDLSMKLELSS